MIGHTAGPALHGPGVPVSKPDGIWEGQIRDSQSWRRAVARRIMKILPQRGRRPQPKIYIITLSNRIFQNILRKKTRTSPTVSQRTPSVLHSTHSTHSSYSSIFMAGDKNIFLPFGHWQHTTCGVSCSRTIPQQRIKNRFVKSHFKTNRGKITL